MKQWEWHRDNNPAFCLMPFTQAYVDTEGKANLCCIADWKTLKHSKTSVKNEGGLHNIWTGKEYQDIRQRMLAGEKVPECKRCWRADASGGGSDRETYNRAPPRKNFKQKADWDIDIKYGNTTGAPIAIDLRPGNFCNLKCRMCFPQSSSAIGDDCMEHEEINAIYKVWPPNGDFNWFEDENAFNEIVELLPNMYSIKIVGGEPLFMQGVIKLLRHCVNTGLSKNINLDITTNCTRQRGKVVNMLGEFKSLTLCISLDGVKTSHDYIRYPSNIKDVLKNYNEYIKLVEEKYSNRISIVNILMTVQLYNIFEIADVIEYWNNIQRSNNNVKHGLTFNFVDNPSCFDIRLLPLEYKKQVKQDIENARKKCGDLIKGNHIHRLEHIIHDLLQEATNVQYSDGKKESELQKEFVERTRLYDRIRNQNIADVDIRLKNMVDMWDK